MEIMETLRWITSIAIGAAIGGIVGTCVIWWLMSRKSAKMAENVIKSLRNSPEFQENWRKMREILDALHKMLVRKT